jgi:hypothetical protein
MEHQAVAKALMVLLLFLSIRVSVRRKKFNAESARLQAGRCAFVGNQVLHELPLAFGIQDDDGLISSSNGYRHIILPQGVPGSQIVLSSVLNHTVAVKTAVMVAQMIVWNR